MQVEKSLKGARFSSFFGHRKRGLLACCFGLWLWPSLSWSMGAFKTKRRVGYVPTLPLGSLNSRATKPVWSMTELTDLLRPLTPLRDWFTVALALMEFARDLTSLTSAQRSPTNKNLFVVELMIWEVISVQFCHHDQMTRHNITLLHTIHVCSLAVSDFGVCDSKCSSYRNHRIQQILGIPILYVSLIRGSKLLLYLPLFPACSQYVRINLEALVAIYYSFAAARKTPNKIAR